jgi:pimeloyl-ACP methyl ester carboxylesterase
MFSENIVLHKGKEVYYRVTGTGMAVVLIHGFGETGNVWKHQFDAFPGYRLIIPDLPGTGRSEMNDDLTMEGLAEAVKTVLDQEIKENKIQENKAVVIGHSMGGYVTLAFAEKYPEMITATALFHSSAFADSEEKKQTRKKGIAFIREHGPLEFLKTTIPNLYAPETREKRTALIASHLEDAKGFSSESLIGYYEAMMQRKDRTDVLRTAISPVLFIFGRHDTAVPIEDGLKQCHLPNVSEVHIIETAGHMGMVEETNTSNDQINQFLSRITYSPA